jgi:hypothetical protein
VLFTVRGISILPGKKFFQCVQFVHTIHAIRAFWFIHDVAGSHGGVMDEEGTSHPLEPVLHLNGRPPSPLPIPMPQKQTGIDLNPPLAEAIFKGIEDAAVEKLGTFSPFPYTFS